MGRRIREHDWAATPLGQPERWPQALRGALGICLQSSFPTAIYWGSELRVLYNDAWAPIAGIKHPWALGRSAQEVWPEIWHVIEPQFRDVIENARGLSLFDQMLPMRRGGPVEETWWNYSFTPILDERGNVAGVFNQGNETTERVMGARRREAEIDRLRELFQQAPGAVAVLEGPRHVFEMANPAYMQLIGNRPVLGKPAAEAVPEVAEQGFIDVLDAVFRTGEAHIGHSTHMWLQRTAGAETEERVLDFVYQPIKSAAGRVTGIFVQATDVTERARTEVALRESEAALRDADRLKDEFLATLAHELRNPLAPILSATRLIESTASSGPTLRAAAGIVARQVQVMVRLVDDLLDVSRVTRGRIELRMQHVSLESIVKSAVESAEPMLADRRHQLVVQLPDTPVMLVGDPVRLSQALLNVVNNAVRYTPPGGRIAIRAAPDGDCIRIGVADNGIGIRPESLERIFDLFAQGDQSEDRGTGGLGIGLHLARRLIELHGGELKAHSEGLGRGSEFVLTLPAAMETASGAEREPSDAGAHPSRRVLVVDDNVDAADSLALNLELAGHVVRAVYDGSAVLDALRDFAAEVVLLDIGLPGISGYDLARAIRRRLEGGDRILLVAISGWGRREDKRAAVEAGFDDHLTKPVDPAVVDALVRRGAGRVKANQGGE